MKLNNQETTSDNYTMSEKQALLSIAGISALVALFSAAVVTYSSQADQQDVAMALTNGPAPVVDMQPPAL